MTQTAPKLIRTVGPSVLPVSIADAKKHLELIETDTTHDDQLQGFIEAATEQFEHDTSLIASTQTYEMVADRFPTEPRWVIPLRPVSSVDSIQYRNPESETNEYATLSSSVATLDRTKRQILLQYGQEWPDMEEQPEGVVVTFRAGYSGGTAKLVKQAILLQVGKWFMSRDMMESRPSEQTDAAYERIKRRLIRTSYP